jgi:hypothetical protein
MSPWGARGWYFRNFERDLTIFAPWHYVPLLAQAG